MTDDAIVAGCPVRAGFDPLAPEFLSDPMAVLASLPADEPLFYAPVIHYFVVTRHAVSRREGDVSRSRG